MDWLKLNKAKAKVCFDEMNDNNNFNSNCDESYIELRRDILNEFDTTLKELNIGITDVKAKAYEVDYIFGIKLYELLTFKYSMNENEAGNDDIWRYIQLKVCPEIIKYRYGINEDRYYKKARRMWLENLWWYVYLGWKDNRETTKTILKDNTTDTILNIIDRTGMYGYRKELFNEILYKKYLYNITDRDQFRIIMILNTMKVQVIDPYLVNGGIEKYVDELFKESGVEIDEFRRS